MKTRAITTSSVCIVSLLTLGLGSAASGASGTPADKATIQRGASLVGIGAARIATRPSGWAPAARRRMSRAAFPAIRRCFT